MSITKTLMLAANLDDWALDRWAYQDSNKLTEESEVLGEFLIRLIERKKSIEHADRFRMRLERYIREIRSFNDAYSVEWHEKADGSKETSSRGAIVTTDKSFRDWYLPRDTNNPQIDAAETAIRAAASLAEMFSSWAYEFATDRDYKLMHGSWLTVRENTSKLATTSLRKGHFFTPLSIARGERSGIVSIKSRAGGHKQRAHRRGNYYSAYPDGSDLFWLWAWAERIDQWMVQGTLPNRHLQGIFKPDQLADQAITRLSDKHPKAFGLIQADLSDVQAAFDGQDGSESMQEDLLAGMIRLRDRIRTVAKMVVDSEAKAPVYEERPAHLQGMAESDPKSPYMLAEWFSAKFGIPSSRLRAARRSDRLAAINVGTKRPRYQYSVPDAKQLWPDDGIYLPESSG